MIQETSTPRNDAERALIDEIHNVKVERMKAQTRGDLEAVSARNTGLILVFPAGDVAAAPYRLITVYRARKRQIKRGFSR